MSFCFIESIVGYFDMFCCSGGSGVSVVLWLWAHGYCSLHALALPSAVLPSEAGQRDRQHALLGWQAGSSGWRLYCWEDYTRREIGVGVDDDSSTCAPKPPSTQLVRLKFRSVRGRSYYLHQEHQATSPSARHPLYLSVYSHNSVCNFLKEVS